MRICFRDGHHVFPPLPPIFSEASPLNTDTVDQTMRSPRAIAERYCTVAQRRRERVCSVKIKPTGSKLPGRVMDPRAERGPELHKLDSRIQLADIGGWSAVQ
jgi:hypothetical protein